jgi:hypothetical protein
MRMIDQGEASGSEDNGGFLDAETAAQELVDRLRRLEVETRRYVDASTHLEELGEAARKLIETEQEQRRQALRGMERRVNVAFGLAGVAALMAFVAMLLASAGG